MLVAGVDNETSHAEVERIVDALASCTSFPTRFLNELAEAANLVQEFEDAVDGLLSINPGERYGLFDTLAWIATSDRQLHQAEIDILYEIGQKSLGFSKTEAAQRLAETIQRTFLPWAL